MPRRILADDFGEDLWESKLSDQALTSYTFITRAVCYYGGCRDNADVIWVKAFKGRATPCVDDVKRMLNEYEQAGLLERGEDKDGQKWLWFKRWFRDNSFKIRTMPSIPRPPSLSRLVTQNDWDSGNPIVFRRLSSVCRKHSATEPPEVEDQEEDEAEVEEEVLLDIFSHLRKTIKPRYKPKPRVLKRVLALIKKRMKTYTPDELKDSLNKFASSKWDMDSNGWREAAWFFSSDDRIEKNRHKKPQKAASEYDVAKGL